jgi:ribonuclease BN (tRNA processing enzyme)
MELTPSQVFFIMKRNTPYCYHFFNYFHYSSKTSKTLEFIHVNLSLKQDQFNPLVSLPTSIDKIINVDAVIATHLHLDHFVEAS